jgi:hypothetical protein
LKSNYRLVKLLFLSIIILIGSLPVMPAATLAKENNLAIENSTFEEPNQIPGWKVLTGVGTISSDNKVDGNNSMQIFSQENLIRLKSDRFPISEGNFELSAKHYVQNFVEGSLDYKVTFYDTEGNILETSLYPVTISDNDQWVDSGLDVVAPEQTAEAEIVLESSALEPFQLFVDQLEVEKTTDGQQLQLTNSSFEESVVIPGWITSGSLLTSTPFEGSNRLRLKDYSNLVQTQAKSNRIPVAANNSYKASAKMNVITQSHSVEFALSFYDDKNVLVGFKNELHKGKAGLGWQEIILEADAPAEAVTMQISFNSGKISLTDVYFDNVFLTEQAPEPPVEDIFEGLVNAGFEMPVNSDGSVPGWNVENGLTGVTTNKSVYHSGNQSLHFKDTSDQTGLRVLSNKIAVEPGASYLAKGMTHVIQQSHNIVFEVHYYDSENNELVDEVKFELFGNLPKNQWDEIKVFTDAPVNASYARLALYSGGISLTETYFDDISWELAEEELALDREYETPANLGKMVQVQLGQASVIQENSKGEKEVYYHSNGLPGTFSVLDAETGELKFSQVIEETEALWAMTVGYDKNVYFAGTANGKLYRYIPELKVVEELGVNPSDDWVWDIEASEDGKIYGTTYPNASVFEYDIATGQFRNYGTAKEGQQYARGLAVNDEFIYVGIGTTKHLIKINRVTGEKEEVLIEGHSGQSGMIENITIIKDKLFVSVGSITMLVIDPNTNEILHTFKYSNKVSNPSPYNENLIYYKFENRLYQYDFSLNESKVIENLPLLPDTVRVKDMEWLTLTSGETVLAMVTQYGEYMLFNPETNEVRFIALDISSQAVAIQSLKAGFDGKLYMGGYQRGMSIYNPFSQEIEVNLPTFAQPEEIGFLNDKVYYGTYVGARMYSYDPLKEIDLNSNPSFEYDIEDHQDRPFSITSGDNKLFVGTVPDYGVLGGALAIFDEQSDSWSQYRNVVQDQSIIGLAYKDGKLYGSTSVWGGLGINPKAEEAKIFVWDVAKGEKIDEFTVDIPGIDETPKMIGEISFGPDGNLWGAVDGTIFAMNPETKEVIKSKVIRPSLYNSSKWLPYRLEWAPDGMLYTTLARKLIAIDPETLAYKVLVEDFMNNMTLGIDGSIYYALGNELHQIKVPETDATLKSIAVDGTVIPSFSPGTTNYTLFADQKDKLEVLANQPGADIDMVDGENSITIVVTGTDGKSEKEYTIIWKQPYAMDVKNNFVNKDGKEINQLTASEMIVAEIEVTNKKTINQDILVMMELLNEKGQIVDVSRISRTIPKNKTMKMSTKLKLPEMIEGYTVKVTAWEGKKDDENLIPLSDEFIITD